MNDIKHGNWWVKLYWNKILKILKQTSIVQILWFRQNIWKKSFVPNNLIFLDVFWETLQIGTHHVQSMSVGVKFYWFNHIKIVVLKMKLQRTIACATISIMRTKLPSWTTFAGISFCTESDSNLISLHVYNNDKFDDTNNQKKLMLSIRFIWDFHRRLMRKFDGNLPLSSNTYFLLQRCL